LAADPGGIGKVPRGGWVRASMPPCHHGKRT
jgi:hypothetical protein